MVKSNKFDYTGRTSSGPKLGRSIASDLEKRADKKQREANKPSTATRLAFKLHAPTSRGSKKDDRDGRDTTKSDIHKLDIKVPGKSLTDDGFALLADGLQRALTTCQDLALVDLNLSDNALTTRSLARLAPIIHQSRYTLQTLDLSQNSFRVSNFSEAQEWETFLEAFRPCMTLRRLDLSHNTSLGSCAFEVFARVYNREPPVDPLPAGGYRSLITLPDEDLISEPSNVDDDDNINHVRNGNAPELPSCANGKTMADPWILNYRCGLRSIPYMTLSNVGLTDTGALFLSYILEQHYYPIQLVTEINATEATSPIRTYRQDANTKGIDWDHNTDTLTKDGIHLLQCAEKLRLRTLLGDTDSITGSFISAAYDACDVHDPNARAAHLRRPSFRSVASVDYSIYDRSNIESARKKIQRNTIVHAGYDSVELWRVSLSAIIQSRKVFLLSPMPRTLSSTPSTNGKSDGTPKIVSFNSDELRYAEEQFGQHLSTLSLQSDEENQSRPSYAAKLMTSSPANSSDPGFAITDVTSFPIAPVVQSSSRVLKSVAGSSNHSTSSEERYMGKLQHTLDGPIQRDDSSQRYMDYQNNRMTKLRLNHGGESDGYRDVGLRCRLPLPVCLQVLGYVMDPQEISIMDEEKQKKAFAWGQKKDTLTTESEWRMKDESSQILMLLAGAECVEY